MLVNNEVINKFKKRRSDSLASAICKIELILDFTKIHKLHTDTDNVVRLLAILKSNIKKDSLERKYINISSDMDYAEVSESISESCRSICENIAHKEISNFQKEMLSLLSFAEDHQISRCNRSIDDVIGLFENSKYKEMDDNLFKIKQDILSSLNYNDKIEKEILLEKSSVKK